MPDQFVPIVADHPAEAIVEFDEDAIAQQTHADRCGPKDVFESPLGAGRLHNRQCSADLGASSPLVEDGTPGASFISQNVRMVHACPSRRRKAPCGLIAGHPKWPQFTVCFMPTDSPMPDDIVIVLLDAWVNTIIAGIMEICADGSVRDECRSTAGQIFFRSA